MFKHRRDDFCPFFASRILALFFKMLECLIRELLIR
jgi:hypothetical protein